MANIRIKDQATDTSLSAGDYIIVDSGSEGTRKFDLGTELTNIKSDLDNLSEPIEIYVEGTSLVINTLFPSGDEVSY